MMQTLDGRGISAFVESGFLNGRADEQAPVTAWNEIGLRGADHMFQQSARRHREAEHLSFDRTSGKGVWTDLSGPGSGAIHDLGSAKCGSGIDNAAHFPAREIDRLNRIA